ncbi:outer membrane lipoprotein-sorting protein [Myxococcota bacterium]|nr:outer membrane lipoprotein-sorting protein [Myxococcota bacterium]
MLRTTRYMQWNVLSVPVLIFYLPLTTWAEDIKISDRKPEEILSAAFTNRYEIDLISRIELRVRDRSGQERKRVLQVATKLFEDRVHSIGRLESPTYLRGMTVLMIEAKGRGHETFMFMPSLNRVRRISTAQRGDAFFGTDVTYEDIERRRLDDYEILDMTTTELLQEPVYRIRARPRAQYSYANLVFTIAQRDSSILAVEYFKRGAKSPYRVISAPREHMTLSAGHVLPTRMYVENRTRGTTTEVHISNLHSETNIGERFFSVRTLESGAPIPRQRSTPTPRE